MTQELERIIVERLLKVGPQSSVDLLSYVETSGICSRASFYRELRRLEELGCLVILEKQVLLRAAYFTSKKIEQQSIETAAFEHSDTLLAKLHKCPQRWTVDTLPRLHALWSSVALAILKLLPGAPYVGWSPYPWFHLSNENLETQALTAHFADRHAFTTITGPCGKLGEEYLSYFKSRGGLVRRVSKIPENLRGTHLSVIEDHLISVSLSSELKEYLQYLFVGRGDFASISEEERAHLNGLRSENELTLEKNPMKAKAVLKVLLDASE